MEALHYNDKKCIYERFMHYNGREWRYMHYNGKLDNKDFHKELPEVECALQRENVQAQEPPSRY